MFIITVLPMPCCLITRNLPSSAIFCDNRKIFDVFHEPHMLMNKITTGWIYNGKIKLMRGTLRLASQLSSIICFSCYSIELNLAQNNFSLVVWFFWIISWRRSIFNSFFFCFFSYKRHNYDIIKEHMNYSFILLFFFFFFFFSFLVCMPWVSKFYFFKITMAFLMRLIESS